VKYIHTPESKQSALTVESWCRNCFRNWTDEIIWEEVPIKTVTDNI